MKKCLVIFLSVLFLCACGRGKRISEKSGSYRKKLDTYYYSMGIYGTVQVETKGESFEVLAWSYAKDKENVFYKFYRLPGADPETFELLGDYYGKDKNYVFFQHYRLPGANPATFRVLTLFSGYDDKHVFHGDRLVGQTNINSFYAREKNGTQVGSF